jgi:Tol biopolymer transport system component
LTTNEVWDGFPAFSPSGEKLVFNTDRDLGEDKEEIYTMDVADANNDGNGDNQTRLTNDATSDYKPNWGPLSSTYNFGGFFSPVDNADVLNKVKAGSTTPVKFTLGGDQGLDIFAKTADGSSFPKSGAMACGSTDPVDAIEQTVNASSSGLTYDAATDRYPYVWKTQKAWTGCSSS